MGRIHKWSFGALNQNEYIPFRVTWCQLATWNQQLLWEELSIGSAILTIMKSEKFIFCILNFILLFDLSGTFPSPPCCFPIEISFLERIWFWKIIFISCPSIFFLNIPLQLKRQLRKWWLFSKNYCQCRKRDIQTKYVTLRNAFESTKYFSHIQRASLLHIESIITPLNSTTSNKNWSVNGILIIKRQFGSNKSGIILEQRQGVP